MARDPRDKELIDGRANKRPAEAPPNDTWGRSLRRQYDPGTPPYGADIEAELKRKRGPTGKSRHPGFG